MRVLAVLLILWTGLPHGASVYTQCGNDSFALHDSSTRVGELDDILNGAELENCTSVSSERVACAYTHDYHQLNTSVYRRACLESGGTFFRNDLTVSCDYTVNGTNILVNAHTIQTPNCAARSCTEDFDTAVVKDVYLTYFYGEDSGCDIVIANLTIEHHGEVPHPSQHPITAPTSGNIRGSFQSITGITVLASLAIALG
jgi:hypothetical protein